jgi:hypothetical protein
MEREQLEPAVVDFNVELVDRHVAGDDALDQREIALDQAPDGEADAVLREAAHFEQARLELFELLLEMSNDAFYGFWHGFYPNRPVT